MDGFSNSQDYSQSTYFGKPAGSGSGLTLVLPSLKNIKAAKGAKKGKRLESLDVESQEKRAPRSIKLKPLKEVLEKLISQIKKKDDYAFFLIPVDASHAPGYTEVVKRPMDLGTMTEKVNKGKYRSLEDFASDLRLIATNAKIYNPPGSIYYTEAERIEAWGLDHIAKAASTVIQYETDWNIEIEKDDDVNLDEDEENDNENEIIGMSMDVDERPRSVSVVSQVQSGIIRRGPRGPYKKHNQTHAGTITESIDLDGRLPGSKDGLGAFPPGSDWAKMMVTLKLKGKRYRTKKERMRIEKEGPPCLPEGSLDYTEMEDPFALLSVLVADSPTRPNLMPIYTPLLTQVAPESSTLQGQSRYRTPLFPCPVNLSSSHILPNISAENSNSLVPNRKHWTIIRHPPSRGKGKERDDEIESVESPSWRRLREPHSADFGSFAVLAGEIIEELKRRGIAAQDVDEEALHFNCIRESLKCERTKNGMKPDLINSGVGVGYGTGCSGSEYWSTDRAIEAEEYIRDVVYGGVDGLAYVRSLAQFVTLDDSEIARFIPRVCYLDVPIAKWVERNIVDPLTDGRHSLLRETASCLGLSSPPSTLCHESTILGLGGSDNRTVDDQVSTSLHLYPAAANALTTLSQIVTHKIDMSALIKSPDELFQSEKEWAGKELKNKRRLKNGEGLGKKNPDADLVKSDATTVAGERTWMNDDSSTNNVNSDGSNPQYDIEGPEELKEVLDYVADLILEVDRQVRTKRGDADGDTEDHGERQPSYGVQEMSNGSVSIAPVEEPTMRNLRLNLLALAKRAPLDCIARLPKDLVPEHIRHFVPTLETSTSSESIN